jgi:predicted kinase
VWLVALKGMPGSGKSTLGRALGRRLGWPLVDKDDAMDLLAGRAPDAGRLAYDVTFNIARRQLRQGLGVICDSPLTFASLYAQAGRIAAETGAALAVVECRCADDAAVRRRIEARQALGLPAHHQTTWAGFLAYRARVLDATRYPIADPHLVVDTTRPLEECVDETIAWLERHAGAGRAAAGADQARGRV